MLYLDTCVLLAVLTPEAHSAMAVAFLQQASTALAISAWSLTELLGIASSRGASLCSLDADPGSLAGA